MRWTVAQETVVRPLAASGQVAFLARGQLRPAGGLRPASAGPAGARAPIVPCVTESGDTATILRDLLDCISRTPGCVVVPAAGTPTADPSHPIPADLQELYRQCGGAQLFRDGPYRWRLCGPNDLVPASPRLLTEDIAREILAENPDELTNGCFVVADGGGASTDLHVVIDLDQTRVGRCYLVAWDTYGLVGEMPIVATSVPDLLRWLLSAGGEYPALTASRGDAYDR
jgi:hypothetical protein